MNVSMASLLRALSSMALRLATVSNAEGVAPFLRHCRVTYSVKRGMDVFPLIHRVRPLVTMWLLTLATASFCFLLSELIP